MAIIRLNGATCPITANSGARTTYIGSQNQAAPSGVDNCPTLTGTPNGRAFLHSIVYSNLSTDSPAGPNTVADPGAMQIVNRLANTVSFAPATALSGGEQLGFDIRFKDAVDLDLVVATANDLPSTGTNLQLAFVEDSKSYYEFSGGSWQNRGGNYTVPGRIDNVDTFIQFSVQAASGGGGSTGGGSTGGSGEATFNADAWAALNSSSNRAQMRRGEPYDMTQFVNNPDGSGNLALAGAPTSIGVTEIQLARWSVTVQKTSGQFQFPFTIEQ